MLPLQILRSIEKSELQDLFLLRGKKCTHDKREYLKRPQKRKLPRDKAAKCQMLQGLRLHDFSLTFFRLFQLELHQNPFSVFADDAELLSTNGPINYDTKRIYEGVLAGKKNGSTKFTV